MAKSSAYVQFIIEEVFGHIPGISARGMFGGYGLYKDGIIFGLIDDDRLFFKTNLSTQGDFEGRGSKPFTFTQRGKVMQTSYWEVPEEILDDRDEIERWLQKAVQVSIGSKKKI